MKTGKGRQVLSELEGAIMLEVHLRNRCTAFQVRKAFITSPTRDWSGSGGAVYPAIKRLEARGFLVRRPKSDGRGKQILSATAEGIRALHEWAVDPQLASALAADPFRTRVDYLLSLKKGERAVALQLIEVELSRALEVTQDMEKSDHPQKVAANIMATMLLKLRLDWIARLKRDESKSAK